MSSMPDEKMHTRCSSPRRTDQSRPGTARCLYLYLNKQKKSVRFRRFVLRCCIYTHVYQGQRGFLGLRGRLGLGNFFVEFSQRPTNTKTERLVTVKEFIFGCI